MLCRSRSAPLQAGFHRGLGLLNDGQATLNLSHDPQLFGERREGNGYWLDVVMIDLRHVRSIPESAKVNRLKPPPQIIPEFSYGDHAHSVEIVGRRNRQTPFLICCYSPASLRENDRSRRAFVDT